MYRVKITVLLIIVIIMIVFNDTSIIVDQTFSKTTDDFLLTPNKIQHMFLEKQAKLVTEFKKQIATEGTSDIPSDSEIISETMVNWENTGFIEEIDEGLGIAPFTGRAPDKLDIKSISLNGTTDKYEVLSFSNPFQIRLLIFNKTKFVDYIDLGGHMAGNEFELQQRDGKLLIIGNRCRGYGTGEFRNYKEWYTVDEHTKKLLLSIPFDEYSSSGYWGYCIKANSLIEDLDGSITVSYDFKNEYLLNIDISNENGYVVLEGTKTIAFKWDKTSGSFLSEFNTDEDGFLLIPVENEDMVLQRNNIWDKYQRKLREEVITLNKEKNKDDKRLKLLGFKHFISDLKNYDNSNSLLNLIKELE